MFLIKSIFFWFVICHLSICSSVEIQFMDIVRHVKSTHPLFLVAEKQRDFLEETKREFISEYGASLSFNHAVNKDLALSSASDYESSQKIKLSEFQIKKGLWQTGTSFELFASNSNIIEKYNQPSLGISGKKYTSLYGIKVEQQLFGDAFGYGARSYVKAIESKSKADQIEQNSKRNEFLKSIADIYAALAKSTLLKKNTNEKCRAIRKNVKITREMQRTKLASKSDYLLSRLNLENCEVELLEHDSEINSSREKILMITGMEDFNGVPSLTLPDSILHVKDVGNSRLNEQLKNLDDYLSLNASASRSYSFPTLSFFVTASKENEAESLSSSFKNGVSEYAIGISLNANIEDSPKKSKYRSALLEKQIYRYKKNYYIRELKGEIKSIEENKKIIDRGIEKIENKVKLLQKLVDEETNKYGQGKINYSQLAPLLSENSDLSNELIRLKVLRFLNLVGRYSLTNHLGEL